jgi:hypothetical protein
MIPSANILLGFYQLIIHLFCLILVETIIFYFVGFPKAKEIIDDILDSIKEKTKINDLYLNRNSNYLENDVNVKYDFLDKYISSYNTYILVLTIFIMLILAFIGTITYIIFGKFTYNITTTISSLIISLIIQLTFLFDFSEKNVNPETKYKIKSKFRKILLEKTNDF